MTTASTEPDRRRTITLADPSMIDYTRVYMYIHIYTHIYTYTLTILRDPCCTSRHFDTRRRPKLVGRRGGGYDAGYVGRSFVASGFTSFPLSISKSRTKVVDAVIHSPSISAKSLFSSPPPPPCVPSRHEFRATRSQRRHRAIWTRDRAHYVAKHRSRREIQHAVLEAGIPSDLWRSG